MSILKIENISKYYGTEDNEVKALDNINLEFTEAQFGRIDNFCRMLKAFQPFDSNSKRLCDNEAFSTEEKINVYIDKIKQKKAESKFDIKKDLQKQISIFIEMLNNGNSAILKTGNKETLEGYPEIKLSYFWQYHNVKIQQILFGELKGDSRYDTARKLVENYLVVIDVDKKISIFIDMLNKGNSAILKTGNKETLEGYPEIKLSYFWQHHNVKIKQKLFIELKDNPEYDTARELIEINKVENNIDIKIAIFINMLNKGNSAILKTGNKETLEGYPSVNLSHFWMTHQNKIKQKLFVELKDNSEYDVARQIILKYYNVSSEKNIGQTKYSHYISKSDTEQRNKRNIQKIDHLAFELGAKCFEEGASLDKVPEKYKSNESFIKGYERAKRLSIVQDELYELGRRFFLSGMSLDDAPERYRNDKNFINGFNSEEEQKKWR